MNIRCTLLLPLLLCVCPGLMKPSGMREVVPETLAIFIEGQEDFGEITDAEIRNEVDRIMSPIGLRLEWRDLEASTHRRGGPAEVFDHLVVARFKGECSADAITRGGRLINGRTLAFAHVSNGGVIPFIEVGCDQVWALIRPLLRSDNPTSRERRFGTALGRVLAHEVYHALGETRKHGRAGLAKAQFSAYDLVLGDLAFEDNELMLLWRKVHPEPPGRHISDVASRLGDEN